MALDLQFWLDLRVNVYKVLEEKEQYLNVTRQAIVALEDEANILANALFGREEWTADLLENLETEKAQELAFLVIFASGKDRSVHAVYESLELEEQPDAVRHLTRLALLYRMDFSHLKTVYNHYFTRQWGRPVELSVSGDMLPVDELILALADDETVRAFPTDDEAEYSRYVLYHVGRVGNSVYASFRRRMSDRVVEDIGGNTRVRFAAFVTLEIITASKRLNIYSSAPAVISAVKDMVSRRFAWQTSDVIPNLAAPNAERFRSFFVEPKVPIGPEITGVSLRRSLLPGAPKVTVTGRRGDVMPSIRSLVSDGSVVVDTPLDVERMNIRFNKRLFRVSSVELSDGSIVLQTNARRISDLDLSLFRQWFSDELGCPVDVPINPLDFATGLAMSYDHVFGCNYLHEVPEHLMEVFRRMQQCGWVTVSDSRQFRCTNCSAMFQEPPGGTCPTCGGHDFVAHIQSELVWNRDEIQRNCLRRLNECGWMSTPADSKRKVARTDYAFRKIEKGEHKVFLLWPDRRLSHADVKRLQSLNAAICILNYRGQGASPDISRLAQMTSLSVAEVLALPTGELQTRLDKTLGSLKALVEQRRLNAAEESYHTVTGSPVEKISPDDFERHVFNLLARIFPDAIPWGREHSGERLPEGIFTLEYPIGEDKVKRVFTWDCKHASDPNAGFDITTPDRDNAALYVGSVLRSQELRNYGGRLEAHIFVSNAFRKGQFAGVRQTIIRANPEWRGKVVFLEFSALVKLYEWVRDHPDVARLRRDLLMSLVHGLLAKIISVQVNRQNVEACHVTEERVADVLGRIPTHLDGFALNAELLEFQMTLEGETTLWYTDEAQVEAQEQAAYGENPQ